MAIEDNLDQLYTEAIANRILCSRLLGILGSAAPDERAWLADQLRRSLESVDLWRFEGHRNPAAMASNVKAAITEAFRGIIIRKQDAQLQ